MPSNGELQKQLKNLTEKEKHLWKYFREAEKQYSIPIFNIWHAHQLAKPLVRSGELNKTKYYPALAAAMILASILCLHNMIFLLLYFPLVILTLIALDHYKNAATKHKLKNSNFVLEGFGIDNLSLITYGLLNISKDNGLNLKKSEVSSIIKIVKSRQETDDVNIGFSESIKRLIYTSIFTLPFAISANFQYIKEGTIFLKEILNKHIVILIYACTFVFWLLWVTFDLIYMKTKMKKQQKRYLLMLNIIHESWTEK